MKKMQTPIVSKIMAAVLILVLSTMNASAIIFFNSSDVGFEKDGVVGEESTSPQVKGLRELIVEGAGYFLDSSSNFLLFLNKVEVAELVNLDYNEVQMNLNSAIEKMKYARDTYTHLKQIADITPYNPTVIEELSNFDYADFQKNNGLIEPIFDQVRAYLEKGNIREIYEEALSNTEKILNIASIIKEKIDDDEFPEISDLWELNESCSKSLLFGQYAARVFFEICQSK